MILDGIKIIDINHLEELIANFDENTKQYLRNDFNGISNIIELTEDKRFIYNNQFEVNKTDNFSVWSTFYLDSVADIDSWGDKSKMTWLTNTGLTAIVEELKYIRYKVGTGLMAKLYLKRELLVRYFRYDGTYEEYILPTRVYNENERVEADKKSRSSILERVRKNTATLIFRKCLMDDTRQLIEPQLMEALKLFDGLQKFVTLYREEREHKPLVQALQLTPTNENLKQETLDYIINSVNIDYYEN